ncbi:hypothetical protein ABID58_006389 [Bradyrhizobium sp. S3.2.6]
MLAMVPSSALQSDAKLSAAWAIGRQITDPRRDRRIKAKVRASDQSSSLRLRDKRYRSPGDPVRALAWVPKARAESQGRCRSCQSGPTQAITSGDRFPKRIRLPPQASAPAPSRTPNADLPRRVRGGGVARSSCGRASPCLPPGVPAPVLPARRCADQAHVATTARRVFSYRKKANVSTSPRREGPAKTAQP